MSSPLEESDHWTRTWGWEGWSIIFSFVGQDAYGGGDWLLKSHRSEFYPELHVPLDKSLVFESWFS